MKKKRTPPPPVIKPTKEPIPEDLEITTDPIPEKIEEAIKTTLVKETDEVIPATFPVLVPPPMPIPSTKNEPDEELFFVVEEMPRFPGCEDKSMTKEEKKACAESRMLKYIYGKINYPDIARELGIEGVVLVQFVIEKDGSANKFKVAKSPGGGLAEETLRVLRTMPQWIPGKQRDRPVRVQFSLPVKYRLK